MSSTPQEASRAAFEAWMNRPINKVADFTVYASDEAKQAAWLGWKARDAEVLALRNALTQVLSDLEIGAHPHLHIDHLRAVLKEPQQ